MTRAAERKTSPKKIDEREKEQKEGRVYNLWLPQQTIRPFFLSETLKKKRFKRGAEEAAKALVFYSSCHVGEGAGRP